MQSLWMKINRKVILSRMSTLSVSLRMQCCIIYQRHNGIELKTWRKKLKCILSSVTGTKAPVNTPTEEVSVVSRRLFSLPIDRGPYEGRKNLHSTAQISLRGSTSSLPSPSPFSFFRSSPPFHLGLGEPLSIPLSLLILFPSLLSSLASDYVLSTIATFLSSCIHSVRRIFQSLVRGDRIDSISLWPLLRLPNGLRERNNKSLAKLPFCLSVISLPSLLSMLFRPEMHSLTSLSFKKDTLA